MVRMLFCFFKLSENFSVQNFSTYDTCTHRLCENQVACFLMLKFVPFYLFYQCLHLIYYVLKVQYPFLA